MQAMHRIKVFTDRYPWLGPLVYVLSIEFFIAQLITASAWELPYSWRFNTISDLGRTTCGLQGTQFVCSPLHAIMNSSLVVIGLIMMGGSLLIYQEFRESRATLLGFSLMAVAGFGTVLVGLFPENVNATLHLLGAGLPFIVGNLSLIILGVALYQVPFPMRAYTFLSGFIALLGLYFLVHQTYGSFGAGGMERVVAYPQAFWLSIFGLYISKSHSEYLQALRRAIRHRLKR